MPTEIEEGEVSGFANPTYTALSSGVVGPVHTIKSSSTAMQNVGPLKAQQHGRHKAWHLQDAPLDRRQRLWSQWKKLANFFKSHQDLLNDLKPPPATVPGK